jgi:protein TonB
MPQFPGGDNELFKFIAENLKGETPFGLCYVEIQGRVICRFVVEKDGSIGQVEVVRSLDPPMDKEAVRLIKSMPKWIPGKQNGKVVRVYFTLPINFKSF